MQEQPKEIKDDPRIGRKARHLLDGYEGTITAIYRWKDGYEHIDIKRGAITCHAQGTNVEVLD